MALVFEQERKLDLNNGHEQNELGPGQYLPQTIPKKISQNIAPFLTSSKKLIDNKEITPGPADYFHDITKEKIDKIKENSVIEIYENKNKIEIKNEIISPNDPVTINQYQATIRLKKNFERYGFLTKEKRWKQKIGNNSLGPGSFFDNKNIDSLNKIQKKIKKNKNKIVKNEQMKLKDKSNKIDSIPGKNNFGYDIGKNGKLIKKENPNQFKIFAGEKGDTVGPGNYDIDFPEQWKKTGTNWSKNQLNRLFEKKIIKKKVNKNINSIDCNLGNFRDRENNKKQNLIYDNYIKGNINNLSMNFYKTYSLNQLTSKDKMIKKIFNKEKDVSYIPKNITPGPGYYYNEELHNISKKSGNKKSNTIFGSTSERFEKKTVNHSNSANNINLGPGQYFINKHSDNFKRRHLKKFITTNSVPFMSITERFNFSQSQLQSQSQKNINNNVDIQNQSFRKSYYNSFDSTTPSISSKNFNQTKYSSMIGTFYSKEPRFKDSEKKLKESSLNPGPGSYINPFSNTGSSNTIEYNGRYVDIRTGKILILNNERPKSSISNKKISFYDIKKNYNACVGKYNPGINLTIEYNNIKKLKESRSNIAFNSGVPADRGELYSFQKNEILGPGKYFIDDNIIKNKKYNNVPFSSSCERGLIESYNINDNNILNKNDSEKNIGPGKYNLLDNYDWIKKSFNIKYI